MNLKLKLWWNDVVKEIIIKKTDVLSDLVNSSLE